MNVAYRILPAVITTFLLIVSAMQVSATNQDTPVPAGYEQADLKSGGLLYDNWLKLNNASPEGNHPLYPAASKKSGKSTWRCKECHGWDYIGAEGRYRKGSHYTGIAGLYSSRNKPPTVLFDALRDLERGHDFSAYLSTEDTWNLVKFIREGQRDIRAAIDAQGVARTAAAAGGPLYAANCASCHGADGNKIDFKKKKPGIQGVGWLANGNPQESLHKIRWGHPGSDMPSMVIDKRMSDSQVNAILAYSQSLHHP